MNYINTNSAVCFTPSGKRLTEVTLKLHLIWILKQNQKKKTKNKKKLFAAPRTWISPCDLRDDQNPQGSRFIFCEAFTQRKCDSKFCRSENMMTTQQTTRLVSDPDELNQNATKPTRSHVSSSIFLPPPSLIIGWSMFKWQKNAFSSREIMRICLDLFVTSFAGDTAWTRVKL